MSKVEDMGVISQIKEKTRKKSSKNNAKHKNERAQKETQ
jgi:hypothetical protein